MKLGVDRLTGVEFRLRPNWNVRITRREDFRGDRDASEWPAYFYQRNKCIKQLEALLSDDNVWIPGAIYIYI